MKSDHVRDVMLLLSRRLDMVSRLRAVEEMQYDENVYLSLDGREVEGVSKDDFVTVQKIMLKSVTTKLDKVNHELSEYGIHMEDE